MPPAPFIPPFDPAPFRWTPGPSDQFSRLTASTLGSTATPDDGFDGMVSTYAGLFPLTGKMLDGLEASLEGAQYFATAFDASGLDQLAQQIGADTAALDNMDNDLQAATAQNAAPPALPATPGDVSLPEFQIPGGLLGPSLGPNALTGGANVLGDLKTILEGLGVFAKSLLALVESALLAVPIYGWIAAGVAAVVALLWHGADPNQVPAAMTEQVFELAGDGFLHLFLARYIDLQTLGGLLASLIAEGAKREQALEAQYGEVRPFQQGIQNMTRVIGDLWTKAQSQPSAPTRPLDLTTAANIWNAQSKAGWYPQSVTAAKQIYDSAVNSIIGRQ